MVTDNLAIHPESFVFKELELYLKKAVPSFDVKALLSFRRLSGASFTVLYMREDFYSRFCIHTLNIEDKDNPVCHGGLYFTDVISAVKKFNSMGE